MPRPNWNSGQVSGWGRSVNPGGTTSQVLTKTSNADYDAVWQHMTQVPRPPVAGLCLPRLPLSLANAGGTGTAGYQLLTADYIAVARNCTLGKFSIVINSTAATPGTVIRIGIYGVEADGRPGSLLSDIGTIDVSSTGGLKTIDFTGTPVAVTADGFYFARCWQVNNSTYGLRAHASVTGGNPGHIYPPATSDARAVQVNTNTYFQVATVSGALPTTPTWVNGDASSIPVAAWEVVSVP